MLNVCDSVEVPFLSKTADYHISRTCDRLDLVDPSFYEKKHVSIDSLYYSWPKKQRKGFKCHFRAKGTKKPKSHISVTGVYINLVDPSFQLENACFC